MKHDLNQLTASNDVKGLLKAWWSTHKKEEKEKIIASVAEIGNKESVIALLEIFWRNPINDDGKLVADTLVQIGDAELIAPIIDCLKNHSGFGTSIRDVGLNQNLAWILSSIGRPLTEPLIKVLIADDDLDVQMWVIGILGKIGDGRAAKPIVDHAVSIERNKQNTKWFLRWTRGNTADHIKALQLIGEPAVAPLREIFNHDNKKVREFAQKALKQIE